MLEGRNRLLIAILTGIVLGVLLGGLAPAAGQAVKFIGEMFIRALLMLVVPLIMATMTVGISRLGDIRRLGGIGGRTIAYYLLTTALSVLVGITLVNLVQPGRVDTEEGRVAMRGGELLPDAPYHITNNTFTLIYVVAGSCTVRSRDHKRVAVAACCEDVSAIVCDGIVS